MNLLSQINWEDGRAEFNPSNNQLHLSHHKAMRFFFILLHLTTTAAASLELGNVLGVMELVADYQLRHPSPRAWTEWVQSSFLLGLAALSGVSHRYREVLLTIAQGNKFLLGPRVYHADDMLIGSVYFELWNSSSPRRRDLVDSLRERCDYVLANPPKGGSLEFKGKHRTDHWTWCDSLFMAPPAWLQLYSVTKMKSLRDYAVTQWWQTSEFLYEPKERLYYRDSSYFGKRERNGRKMFWSRGNGWVLAGLARLLEVLPIDDPARPRFVAHFKVLATRIRELQNEESGGWSSSLLDPTSCSPPFESSGTAFFTFAFAWGVNQGLLDSDIFAPAARKAWKTLTGTYVHQESGRVVNVQPIGAAPELFDPNSTEPYGVGGVLLAGRQMLNLGLG